MSSFLALSGSWLLSDFKHARLLALCRRDAENLQDIRLSALYLLKLSKPLSGEKQARLRKLLACHDTFSEPDADAVIIAPRAGTQSAWSSKATDIAHRCNLPEIACIERLKVYALSWSSRAGDSRQPTAALLHDPMTEAVIDKIDCAAAFFDRPEIKPDCHLPVMKEGRVALEKANAQLKLGLSEAEITYITELFVRLERDPSEVELMTFAQVNSEHCRHKTFRASWRGPEDKDLNTSLFDYIRETWRNTQGAGVLSAYSDNAAVLEGGEVARFDVHENHHYGYRPAIVPSVIKVETHNHPTAISPFPGAATGAGGEIRDEGAVGRGSRPKAGLAGFCVSHLQIPDWPRPWETDYGHPDTVASALQIMLEAPIGAAAFNNEFGRPNLLGYFRTFEQRLHQGVTETDLVRGFHKPIMIAGGIGSMRPEHIQPEPTSVGDAFVVLGGPAMLIGLGGGTASSQTVDSLESERDFASVQRGNPEIQRRCQEVINGCTGLGEDNPIRRIHDVGAGGLSNAVSELVWDGGTGGQIDLDAVPIAEETMSPLEIWCNESQERYVLAVDKDRMDVFAAICRRERCPFAVVGTAVEGENLRLTANGGKQICLDLPTVALFGDMPGITREYEQRPVSAVPLGQTSGPIADWIDQVLSFPAVAAKMFLISISDRTVSGLVARDQLVGPWQMPVSDVAVTLRGYKAYAGEAMAMGERPPLALLNPAASARMAIGEALTNLVAADVRLIQDVHLSANWMAAASHPGEAANLHNAVRAASELCIQLGISIPVGKDSLSMRTVWQADGEREVVAPVTLNVSAYAAVRNVRATLTPQLKRQSGRLVFLDLAQGQRRLGGSAWAQVQSQLGRPEDCPDLEHPEKIAGLFVLLAHHRHWLLAYHDRSDGGLLTTAAEMAFAGRTGFELQVPAEAEAIAWLFNEELGALVQVADTQLQDFLQQAANLDLQAEVVGRVRDDQQCIVRQGDQILVSASRADWQQKWWSVSHRLQRLRDHPDCADEELGTIAEETPGLSVRLTFAPEDDITAPLIEKNRPQVAVLREQGVNGQVEMAAAFHAAGFQPVDVHMTDLASGEVRLTDFRGLALCGGFSYGDVLGAGAGWARSILCHTRLHEVFGEWFTLKDRFTLGVCNGCQMLSELREIIPGTAHWPRFLPNKSEQFEARLSLVRVAEETASVLLAGMQGSVMPVAVAHGEGRAAFDDTAAAKNLIGEKLVALQYVDHHHRITERYPYNPNGSFDGIAGLTTATGLVTAMMPHPERVFRVVQHSWYPEGWHEDGPWLRLFRNARCWVDNG